MNNSVHSSNANNKVLMIRMLGSADVCAIGLPAIRLFQKQNPEAELHFLTFGKVAKVIKAVAPNVTIHTLPEDQWPDDFFQAMESFLGLAEHIIADEYSQIINLDTAFMPCFLTRFLKDAGEPVVGNYLSMSIQDLLKEFQTQKLSPHYVNDNKAYLDSSFLGMYQWNTAWWHAPNIPDGGYPEFYLQKCCGFDIADMNQKIDVFPDKRLAKQSKENKVIGLCFEHSEDGYLYPYTEELTKRLKQQGFEVWSSEQSQGDPSKLLKLMAASDLVVCKACGDRWYAQAVDCPVLLITGAAEPATLMPDYATEQVAACVQHGPYHDPLMAANQPCTCESAQDLAESIASIFEQSEDESSHD